MQVVVERDGRRTTVEVEPGTEAVTVGGRRYPVTIVRRTATLVELEIAGERVIVDNWPEHFPEPPGPVDVNGERTAVAIERPAVAASSPVRAPAAATAPAAAPPAATAPPGGHAVVPPMPGKVIEVRVTEGQHVGKGDVLLVLEAMKMRNELASPVEGTVRNLRAAAGTNARAKEPLLFVVSD
jgi:glutaconyl-CoA/methylmalonyl-CoA decarboxylase subunit gamma